MLLNLPATWEANSTRRENEMDTRERMQARRWVQGAIALYESAGKQATLVRIADPEGPFVEGERYIFALDLDGNLLAHPFSKQLVGQNLSNLTDHDGKSFIEKVVATSKTRGYGFIEYRWALPNSNDDLHKTVFFERVDEMVLCSGFYTVGSPLEDIFRCFSFYGPC
jgi:hypothetical protein